jgi:putative transposase
MHRLRSIRFSLYPNANQQALLVGWLTLHRDLYNAALQQRLYAWQRSRHQITYADQVSALPKIKTYFPEYLNCGDQALCATLHRVDAACNKYYTKKYVGMQTGFPRFKSLLRFNNIVYAHARFRVRKIKKRLWKIDIPNIGSLRARGSPRVDIAKGKIQSINIRVKNNHWEILLIVAYDLVALKRHNAPRNTSLGLSTGYTDDLIATSDGYVIKFPTDIIKLHKATVALGDRAEQGQPITCKEKGVFRKVLSIRKALFQKRRDFLQQITAIFTAQYTCMIVARGKFQSADKKYQEFIHNTISLLCFTLVYKAEEAGGRASITSARSCRGNVINVARQALAIHTGQELAKMSMMKELRLSNST